MKKEPKERLHKVEDKIKKMGEELVEAEKLLKKALHEVNEVFVGLTKIV